MAKKHFSLRRGAFTLVETMISTTVLGALLAVVYAGSTALLSSMTVTESYSVGQLQLMDYLTLDLRRAGSFNLTTTSGKLTLPLDLYLPQYYASDGRTPNAPQRTLVTTSNKKDKKKHKVFEARYYYSYGTLGSTNLVRYTLVNGTVYRSEGTLPPRVVGSGIQSVTFGPDIASIQADPMINTTVAFLPTKRAKQTPPPLTSTTFMREYYYADFN